MHTATHTTDQLATYHREAAERHARSEARRQHPSSRSTRRTVVGVLAALAVGSTLVAGPATAASSGDTYTGGDRVVPGLVDGWYEPGSETAPVVGPTNPYR